MADPTERTRSHLPHALAALYAVAIAYASLQPFGEWIEPVADTPFWLFEHWPPKWTRFDLIANIVAYVPLGFFLGLVPRRARPSRRMLLAVVFGAALSFAMETLQWYSPPRVANTIDFLANSGGTLAGAALAAALARSPRAKRAFVRARERIVLPGSIGDTGFALLLLWLVAQMNPVVPLFAVTLGPDIATPVPLGIATDSAGTLIEAAACAFNLLGMGLFVALLVRDRRYAGSAVLLMIAAALTGKLLAGIWLLKPTIWDNWLRPGVALGLAAGALLLLPAIFLRRAVQVTLAAVALLSSLLVPLLAPDLLMTRVPLALFDWRHGHLLNFNGLTHSALLLWPILAAAWLFVLAGRPGWGNPARDAASNPHAAGQQGHPL